MKLHTCKTYLHLKSKDKRHNHLRDSLLTPIHAVNTRRLGQSNVHLYDHMWVWQKGHQHPHNCLNLMILPYRQLTMDNFKIINYSWIKHANIEHISINEDDYTRYINSLYNTTAYSSIIQILKTDMHKTTYRSASDVITMIKFCCTRQQVVIWVNFENTCFKIHECFEWWLSFCMCAFKYNTSIATIHFIVCLKLAKHLF